MAPALFHYLKTHDSEKSTDKFGRLNAQFYRNWVRQDGARPNGFADQMSKHF